MLPYMASYMRNNTDPNIDHEMLVWIPTFQGKSFCAKTINKMT